LSENTFEILFQKLQDMEESQKIDLSVVDLINSLIENCKDDEKFWVKNEKIPLEVSFLLYHSTRNARLVLEKMKDRFLKAEEKHENPKIVSDSITVMPALATLCNIIFSLKGKTITPEIQSFVLKRLKALRSTADEANLLPSPEEEMKTVNRRKLKGRFNRFANTLRAMLVEV